jgi:hypothetical protein
MSSSDLTCDLLKDIFKFWNINIKMLHKTNHMNTVLLGKTDVLNLCVGRHIVMMQNPWGFFFLQMHCDKHSESSRQTFIVL